MAGRTRSSGSTPETTARQRAGEGTTARSQQAFGSVRIIVFLDTQENNISLARNRNTAGPGGANCTPSSIVEKIGDYKQRSVQDATDEHHRAFLQHMP